MFLGTRTSITKIEIEKPHESPLKNAHSRVGKQNSTLNGHRPQNQHFQPEESPRSVTGQTYFNPQEHPVINGQSHPDMNGLNNQQKIVITSSQRPLTCKQPPLNGSLKIAMTSPEVWHGYVEYLSLRWIIHNLSQVSPLSSPCPSPRPSGAPPINLNGISILPKKNQQV